MAASSIKQAHIFRIGSLVMASRHDRRSDQIPLYENKRDSTRNSESRSRNKKRKQACLWRPWIAVQLIALVKLIVQGQSGQ